MTDGRVNLDHPDRDYAERADRLSLPRWIRVPWRSAIGDSLVRNSVYILATTVVTSGLGYVYWVIAARRYLASEVGLGATLISAMLLGATLGSLGIHTALVQFLPHRQDRAWSRTVTAGLLAGGASGCLAGAAVSLLLWSLHIGKVTASTSWAVPLVLGTGLGVMGSVIDYTFVAERAAQHMLVRNFLFGLMKIPLLAWPVLIRWGAAGILGSWVLSEVTTVAIGLLLIRRVRSTYRPVVHGWTGEVRSIISALAAHHAINLGNLAPLLLLPVLVTARLSTVDTAYFYTAWKVGGLFFMVSPAVASSLFAEGSHATEQVGRKARSSVIVIAALLIPAMVFFVPLGRAVLGIFGSEYARYGYGLLMVLLVSAVPDAITNVYFSVLRVQGRLRFAALLNIAMAGSALLLAWTLLPWIGIVGGGVAWLVVQIAGSIVVFYDAFHGMAVTGFRRRLARARPYDGSRSRRGGRQPP